MNATFLGSAVPGTYVVTLTLNSALFSDDGISFTGLTGHSLGTVSGLDTTGATQSGNLNWTWTATVVPEPSAVVILLAAGAGLGLRRRRDQ